jgi:hypothetical protein
MATITPVSTMRIVVAVDVAHTRTAGCSPGGHRVFVGAPAVAVQHREWR